MLFTIKRKALLNAFLVLLNFAGQAFTLEVPFEMYGLVTRSTRLAKRRVMDDYNFETINMRFAYEKNEINCIVSKARSVFAPTLDFKIDFHSLRMPRSYHSDECTLTYINKTSFTGVALTSGAALNFLNIDENRLLVTEAVATSCAVRKLVTKESTELLNYAVNVTQRRRITVVQWENCYAGEESGLEFRIGIAVGTELQKKFGNDVGNVLALIQSIILNTDLVYYRQLNIQFVVDTLLLANTESQWDNPGCSKDIFTHHDLWTYGFAKPKFQGVWHILDDCISQDNLIAGITFQSSLCNSKFNTGVNYCYTNDCSDLWVTFAHEVGHNFGASHSFEEGPGTTGGIMDYGDGTLNGEYQFNSKYRQEEVCDEVNKNIACSAFQSLGGINERLEPLPPVKHATPAPSRTSPTTPYPTMFPQSYPTPFPTTAYPTPFPVEYPTPFPVTQYPTMYPIVPPTLFPSTPYPTNYPQIYPTTFPTQEECHCTCN